MTTPARYLRFSDEAQVVFEKWIMDLQTRLENEDDHPAITEHLGKYRSLMPSLALIFHLIDVADGGTRGRVTEKATRRACEWCQYLESHARRLYGLALDNGAMAAKVLSKKIQAGKLESPFKVRTIQRKGWGRLTDKSEIKEAVAILEDAGWVRELATAKEGGYGRPQEMRYEINPKALLSVLSV